MRILLVNDDGWRAEGLRALNDALVKRGHDVIICAPDEERSGTSHSFTIFDPLRPVEFHEDNARGIYVNGTPADCARLGVYLYGKDIDFVISGINRGANSGDATVYSGTVGAALEAAMCGKQALASSLLAGKTMDFSAAARITCSVAEWAVEHPLPRSVMYNLNVPNLPFEKIKGLRRAVLGAMFQGEPNYKRYESPFGVEHYWLFDGKSIEEHNPETDMCLLNEGYATISALTWDTTFARGMDRIEEIRL